MIRMLTLALATLSAAASTSTPPAEAPRTPAPAAAPVRVVTTLPVYADLTRRIGGAEVEVLAIADPDEDAHFVRPKPSFALELRRADLFVNTGLDLELWVPALLDKAGNAAVMEGGRGYVTAYTGVELLDIPTVVDRSQGDIHIYGNPHFTTDPLRAIQVARNITAGLERVAPDRAALWQQGLQRLTAEIHARLFGAELVRLLGGPALEQMALNGRLRDFLATQDYEGSPLATRLGGWLGTAESFRGERMICYHKSWAYFEERFGVTCAEYVEAKPGIAPTPGHVARLIEMMEQEDLGVVLAESYFDRGKVEQVAERGGARAVIVAAQPGARGTADYFAVVDGWVRALDAAFRGGATSR